MENEHITSTLIFKLVNMRLMLRADILRQVLRKANFNPDQPRVSAGESDGGQWTDGSIGSGGGGANDELIHVSDAPSTRYSINLLDHERYYGGHAIREHVGKTDAELLGRADTTEEVRGWGWLGPETEFRIGGQAGSFSSLVEANDLVTDTLNSPENLWLVQKLERGELDELGVLHRFGFKTGKEAFRPYETSRACMRSTYAVYVYMRPDPEKRGKFTIVTAFPTNEIPGRKN
jgi:hypothetical protein